ncbi:MAG TPA: RcpC/CpaB family pilus assembly protein [Candidatus Dormibacteraeota bacterium]|nr:RcpC/CpaB family pilus assembly protein [Candidatus Dormibacteraeota bacterium]
MTTDLKGRVNQVWIAIGLILAIFAFGAAYYFTRANASNSPTVPSTGQLVVVAKVSIPSGSLINASMLEETRIKGLLPADAYTSCHELVRQACATTAGISASQPSTTSGSDYYAVVPIAPNTVITQNLVSVNKATQSPAFGNLNLPAGEVAVAIPITSQQSVAGYLQVGDRIDLIASDSKGNTSFSYEDLPVISVGSPSTTGGASSSSGGGLIVLELTRSQALGVTEMVKTGAIYTIALRSTADYGHGYVPVSSTPADEYSQACVAGSTVNPIIQEDLQSAQQAVTTATTTYSVAHKQYTKDNAALEKMSGTGSTVQTAKAQLLTDSATLAQDQFALIEAQNELASDQAVLYCGATASNSSSSAAGNNSGSSQMLQNLFGFSIGTSSGS